MHALLLPKPNAFFPSGFVGRAFFPTFFCQIARLISPSLSLSHNACSRGVDVRYEHVKESDKIVHLLAALSKSGAEGHREKERKVWQERQDGKGRLLRRSAPDVILARGLLQHLPLPHALEVSLFFSSLHRHTPALPALPQLRT